jgi:purine nucleoside permease
VCNQNNVHAVLYINGSDSIALMATKYSIPTNVEVHRADDDVLVSNNWNDLTDPTKQLRAPATTAATTASGTIWTGMNTSSTCRNWTSGATGDTGTFGYTTRMEVTWLTEGTFACDSLAALLCICWPGGP